MIPPTPTPVLSGLTELPDLSIPSLWTMAPDAIQTWNQFSAVTTCVQGGIIVLIVGFTAWMVYKFGRRILNNGEPDVVSN